MSMIVGAILAAGKGSRLGLSTKNKTTTLVAGKPLLAYAFDAFENVVDEIVTVVGYKSDSVKKSLAKKHTTFVHQNEPRGTGDAVGRIIDHFENSSQFHPSTLLVGNGDNMLFLSSSIITDLLREHKQNSNCITVLTFYSTNWRLDNGRVIKDVNGQIKRIVEAKSASDEELRITELNSGFYCFDYSFVRNNIKKIAPDKKSGEIQLTKLIELAVQSKLPVSSYMIRNSGIGMGVNTKNQLQRVRELKKRDSSVC